MLRFLQNSLDETSTASTSSGIPATAAHRKLAVFFPQRLIPNPHCIIASPVDID